MMKQMRENTKIILWIVVIAFVITIFAVWGLDLQTGGGGGSQQQNMVGRINGTPITPQVYQSVYSQLAQQYRTSETGQLSATQQEMLHDQAWETIINNTLTDEQVKKLGITVTDQEVLAFLRDAPPPEIRQYFLDDKGNFDFAAYRAALNNPDADWTAVEQLARQRIPLIKLNQYLMSQVHVARYEVRKAFEEDNTRLTFKYVRFPIDSEDIGDYTPGDDEVKTYYAAHPDDFSEEARAAVRYVRLPIVPSAQDRDDINYTISQIRKDLDTDEFAEMARTYSEAPTASVGGDTGFLARSQRPDTVMAAVDALKPGEVSAPIWTDSGVYLVKLIETKKEKGETKYRLNEIFLSLSAGSATTDSVMTAAQDLERSARDEGLEKAAAAAGLAVETSEPFAANVPVAGLGYLPALSRFAFANEPGAVSNVLFDGNNYFVCEISQRLPAGVRPLDEVSDDIRKTLVDDHRRLQAEHKADAFYRKLRSAPGDFDAAAALYNYTVQTADTVTVRNSVDDQPPRSPLLYAAFNMNAGDFSPPVESYNNYYVVDLVARTPLNEAAFAQQADALRQRLYQRKAQEYIAYWYQNLRDNSKIEDFRGAL